MCPVSEGVSDPTVGRLYDLTDLLQERLAEAESIRDRFTRAREGNSWPDPRGAVAKVLTGPPVRALAASVSFSRATG